MANMCSNTLTYIGDNYEKVNAIVNDMIDRMNKLKEGVLPLEIENEEQRGRYFFDIYLVESYPNSITIDFESKWAPPLDEVEAWAKLYSGQWYLDWAEPSSYDVGRLYIDTDGNSKEVRLKDEHFEAITEDDGGCYVYNNDTYESREEIFSEILDHLIVTP